MPTSSSVPPSGLALRERRESLVADFNTVFTPLVGGIMGGASVHIRYRPSWSGLETAEAVTGRLAADRATDLAFGATTSGPHRDRFSCLVDGRDFTPFASTGQVRLCALALRGAQAQF